MIKFDRVSKSYQNGLKVLNNISFHVRRGELLVLIGPSGCGKTTTMKMINRLTEPTQGKVLVQGIDVSKHNPVDLRRNIGYVIQQIGLLPHMTIGENVAIVPKLKKWDKEKYLKRVWELMDMVHLDPAKYLNRYPSELSGGQQQRVGVIRALAADPEIILMDEPFSALDPISRDQLQDELIRLQDTFHKTIIFVTHDMDEAIKLADRICIMKDGKIVQLDTPENILRHPADEFVKNFIGENRLSTVEKLPKISEIMVKPVICKPNKGMAEAILLMRKQKVDTLLVVDKDNTLLGKVSVWDIHSHYQEELITLADIVQPKISVVNVQKSLLEAIYMIRKYQIAYLPVIDDEYKLLGVITRASLVDVMADQFSNVIYMYRGGSNIG